MDELRKFYPNIIENQTQNVQREHFITQDCTQVHHNQEIYISTPDKVIIDNNPQKQIIVNQTPFQNQEYIIQEGPIDNRQPIFYMDETMSMLVAQIPQPINICNPTIVNTMPRLVAPVMKTIEKNQKVSVLPKGVRQQPQKRVIQSKAVTLDNSNNSETNTEILNSDRQEAVSLPDGRIIPLSEYKKLISNTRRGRGAGSRGRGGRQKNEEKNALKHNSSLESHMSTDEHINMPNQYMQRQAPQQSQASCIMGPQQSQHHATPQPPPPPPHFPIPRSQIQEFIDQTPVSEEYSDSIRMLVLLANGEQRLITFTIPKEQCTIQEILEQIGIVLDPETKIDCAESDINGINYIVAVGIPNPYKNIEIWNKTEDANITADSVIATDSKSSPDKSLQQQQPQQQNLQPTPENSPKENPRYVPGRLAVCMHCGYLSEDFNKCLRCKRKLPEEVKSVPTSTNTNAKQIKISKIPTPTQTPITSSNKIPVATPNVNITRTVRKRLTRSKVVEPDPIILTLSSDDEEDAIKSSPEEMSNKLIDANAHLSAMKKEPSMSDMEQISSQDSSAKYVSENKNDMMSIAMNCRTIRIGSYRFAPTEDVIFTGTNIVMKVPHIKNNDDIKNVILSRDNVVKVLVNFQKQLPVIFYYTSPVFGKKVRDLLGMTSVDEYYFDPISKEEPYRRITILPDFISDEAKIYIKQLYDKPLSLIDELTNTEANNILMKTCPKELNKIIVPCFTDIRQLLIYPPGKGGLSINTEDYMCLAQDQFLNDVIIDFYLKYLVIHLSSEKQEKVHVFSTFFYNRLTTKPSRLTRRSDSRELDPNLTPAEKRHARVSKWTKNVNLFEKDFIIIPINENSHWFLAIICFPGLDSITTFDGGPYKDEIEPKREKRLKPNVTIVPVKVEKEAGECEEDEISNKDEAEGDESEMESDDSSEIAPEDYNVKPPIRQPCILIFDSLACTRRSRVIATLRDYLTVEYKSKLGEEKLFTKDVIKGSYPKVPQQTNFTDCGLYLLQFVESFFQNPIIDYRLPIKTLRTWFEEITVTKKREDISNLIKDLMILYKKDISSLPDVPFPTINGKLRIEDEDEEEADEEEEEEDRFPNEDEMDEEIMRHFREDHEEADMEKDECDTPTNLGEIMISPIKVSNDNNKNSGTFTEENIVIKPDLSEIQKQSNRATLSYLKAKRIIRHKNSPNESEAKKSKIER